MKDLFLLLILLSIVGLIWGLISPKIPVFWTSKKTRLNVIIGYPLIFLISFILFGVFSDPQTNKINFKVENLDSTDYSLTFRIVIPERYSKDTLELIALELKEERNWNEKLVCFFNLDFNKENDAWAVYSFLPKCSKCEKDRNGNLIQFMQIGMNREEASNIEKLTYENPHSYSYVTSYLDDLAKAKVLVYKVNSEKGVRIFLSSDSKPFEQEMVINTIQNEDRYYLKSELELRKLNNDTSIPPYYTFNPKTKEGTLHSLKGVENKIKLLD